VAGGGRFIKTDFVEGQPNLYALGIMKQFLDGGGFDAARFTAVVGGYSLERNKVEKRRP